MKKHLLFRAFLPLAAYAVFTELALHGLAGILAAAPDGWTGGGLFESERGGSLG